jgi:hypothetical protein
MFNIFFSLFNFRLIWVPFTLAGVFYGAYIYHQSSNYDQVKRIRTLEISVYEKLSKQWVEGTYRAVGLGVTEGLQSKATFLSSPKPLFTKNPITSLVLRNNLSIACLQMDVIWNYIDNNDIFLVEGNITFKGDHPFNRHLNNSVLYIKSFYVRDEERYILMSTTIDKSKPRGEFKQCSDTRISATRNIRFDTYLEQMNALTFPSGYLAFSSPDNHQPITTVSESSYVSNEEYLHYMYNNKPTMPKLNKKAKGPGALFFTFLSLPGILSAKRTLAKQERAIDTDRAESLYFSKVYGNALAVRGKYLARMSETLKCGKSKEYQSICDLGGGITYEKNTISR